MGRWRFWGRTAGASSDEVETRPPAPPTDVVVLRPDDLEVRSGVVGFTTVGDISAAEAQRLYRPATVDLETTEPTDVKVDFAGGPAQTGPQSDVLDFSAPAAGSRRRAFGFITDPSDQALAAQAILFPIVTASLVSPSSFQMREISSLRPPAVVQNVELRETSPAGVTVLALRRGASNSVTISVDGPSLLKDTVSMATTTRSSAGLGDGDGPLRKSIMKTDVSLDSVRKADPTMARAESMPSNGSLLVSYMTRTEEGGRQSHIIGPVHLAAERAEGALLKLSNGAPVDIEFLHGADLRQHVRSLTSDEDLRPPRELGLDLLSGPGD